MLRIKLTHIYFSFWLSLLLWLPTLMCNLFYYFPFSTTFTDTKRFYDRKIAFQLGDTMKSTLIIDEGFKMNLVEPDT